MKKLTNSKKLEIAKRYYSHISENRIIIAFINNKSGDDVMLKVYNDKNSSNGEVIIAFNESNDEIYLCTEIGIHGCSSISKYSQPINRHVVHYYEDTLLVKKSVLSFEIIDKEKYFEKMVKDSNFSKHGCLILDGKIITKSATGKGNYSVEFIETI